MTFWNVQIAQWPGAPRSPVRLIVKAGVGLSFVLATMFPVQATRAEKHHWSHTVDLDECHRELQHDKITEPLSSVRQCRSCGKKLVLAEFPPKGGGRRESRCNGCHNTHRRSRYKGKLPAKVMSIDLRSHRFDGKHEGFQLLLELICDDVMKGLMN